MCSPNCSRVAIFWVLDSARACSMSLPRSFFTFRANRYKNDAIATHNATMVTANPIRVIRVCSSKTINPPVCQANWPLTSTLEPQTDAKKKKRRTLKKTTNPHQRSKTNYQQKLVELLYLASDSNYI